MSLTKINTPMTLSNFKPNIIRFPSVRSTSNELKSFSEKESLPNFTILITDDQTSGKGQVGNTWESEAGKNLTFSVLLYPKNVAILSQFILSKMVSVAIVQALEYEIDGIEIKWPNDIYIGEKKICGILIENSIMGATLNQTIIGVGININQKVFRSDAPNPTSLVIETGHEHEIKPILDRIIEQLALRFAQVNAGCVTAINAIYFDKLYRRDGVHKYRDDEGDFEAKIVDVLDHGYLVLETRGGSRKEYAFKEVKFM